MAKDKIRYRASRKFALGSLAVEQSIGITQLVSASAVSPPCESAEEKLAERPAALMKWAFDDTAVEEILPAGLEFGGSTTAALSTASHCAEEEAEATAASPAPGTTSLLVRVVSEGVPDAVLERVLRSRLPRHRHASVHFLTPVDYACCASRYVWIRGGDGPTMLASFLNASCVHPPPPSTHGDARGAVGIEARARSHTECVRTPSGEVWLGPCHLINVSADAPTFPLRWLPHLRYTAVLRNVPGSLGSILPRLLSLRDHGCLNYGHVARHGLGSLRAYEDGKALLQRDYATFLMHYANSLSEGTPHVKRELHALHEALFNPKSTQQDWRNVRLGVEMGLKQDFEAIPQWDQTGLYLSHHHFLKEFVTRAADVAPRHHDSAQIIREAVPRRVLQEKLRVVTETHFNAQTSLRWSPPARRGTAPASTPKGVRIGDLVLLPDERATVKGDAQWLLRDVYEGMADHIHGDMTSAAHQDWVYLAQEELLKAQADAVAAGRLRVVKSQAEADTYTIDQVVLPLYGRGLDSLPFTSSSPSLQANDKGSSAEYFHALARELSVEGLPEMRTAPLASFRHLVTKPMRFAAYVCDEQRGWDWTVPGRHGEDATVGAYEDIKGQLYKDQEGITRVRSPLMALNGKNMIARRGIRGGRGGRGRGQEERNYFLKPAQKPGMLCVVRMDLPRGTPITSALREVFQFTTLSPTAVFHLLAHK